MNSNRPLILIIEDDQAAAEAIVAKVEGAGYRATASHTVADGMETFKQLSPDLLVLDVMLPDGDGVSICREVRADSNVPIIMLTAKAEEVDRIVGLETGADDYVTKPFSPKELISRIKAVLRRATPVAQEPKSSIHNAGGIMMDESRHEVTVDGEPVRLTPTEYKILSLLIRQADQVVPRDVLTESIWSYDGFSPNLLEIHIGNIRRKIEQDPRRPRRLITVRSFGYKVVKDAPTATA